ncbi:uncharacterized protein LOC133180715 [Saccostrea echinata]|uniref:uncharacterized protein LOC133180715 n=1 Tax=Saccostrea echinata TaxID=191078 RepID=UPI002A81780E|nr:uncharacterized protein LOC133180715 [Saccostrea echinata]
MDSILGTLRLLFLCLGFNTGGAVYYCNVADPCAQANASSFFEPYARFENCQYDSKYAPCDRYITPQWYRVNDAMLTQCPELLSCGAVYPLWLKGSLPTASEGIVERKACKVGFSSCCSKEYDVKIKHCGSFHVYCLGALDSCSERYCFGKQGLCEYPNTNTMSTTTTPKPTTLSPTTTCSEDPCIESNLQTLTQTEFRSMHCEYKQGQSNCDNHLTTGWYKARFPMLNQCPKLLSCGSIYPVWMNGSVPSTGDGVVTRKACQRGFHSCCSKSYDIKVKNCGKYTAYCLKGVDTCPSRYCFGDQLCEDDEDDKRKSDSDDDGAHQHGNLEIILGVILGVLILILVVMLIIVKKRYVKGNSKTGSTVNIQVAGNNIQKINNLAYSTEDHKWGNPPPYRP